MLSIEILLFVLPFSVLTQIILSPVPCTLACIDKSLSYSDCEKAAQNGVGDPSVLPCLCKDIDFLRETTNCIVNSGECRSIKDQEDSFKYATGLCDSNGIKLPGNTPEDLPAALGVTFTKGDGTLTKSSVPITILSNPIPEITTFDATITTMIVIPTSIACETPELNATYIVVVSNNITETLGAKTTVGTCGNSNTTISYTTTKKVIKTITPKTSAMSFPSTTEAPLSTTTDASGAQGTTAQSGFMLALLSLLMWFV